MADGYQQKDQEIADYQLYKFDGIRFRLRGPQVPQPDLESGNFLAFAGAAQTFGRFVERPFPLQVAEHFQVPALNLGRAGGGPGYFLKQPGALRAMSRSRLTVVQVMSGRSVSNSLLRSATGGEMMVRIADDQLMGSDPAWQWIMDNHSRERVLELIEENRQSWLSLYRKLLESIQGPRLLLWFSARSPDYRRRFKSSGTLMGRFPQFVERSWIEPLLPLVNGFVECTTDAGSPQPLISRFTGQPVTIVERENEGGTPITHNRYYPSPEMHDIAATQVIDAIEALRMQSRD